MKEESINSNLLQITGKAELSAPLDPKQYAKITNGELAVYFVGYADKENGAYDRIYKAKFIGEIALEASGNKLKAKSKSKWSKLLRHELWKLGETDEFYEIFMGKLINNLDETWEFLKER